MTERSSPIRRPLGMLEWDSVARGIEATDALLKGANVELVLVRPVTPGRFVALFLGDVEDVRTAIEAGARVGADSLIDSLFLPAPHPGLVPAIAARTGRDRVDAIGILETLSLCSLLLAADGAAKTGEVHLLEIRLGMGLGGKAFAVLTGEVSQVEAAIQRGTDLAKGRGYHLRSVVVPRPDPRTVTFLVDPLPPFSDFVL